MEYQYFEDEEEEKKVNEANRRALRRLWDENVKLRIKVDAQKNEIEKLNDKIDSLQIEIQTLKYVTKDTSF